MVHPMHPMIVEKRSEIDELCRRYHVRTLQLFGSAVGDAFNPETSDIDFTVEFDELGVLEYGRSYFGLLKELERLFGRHVDLVTLRSVRNPFFKRRVEATQVPIYAR